MVEALKDESRDVRSSAASSLKKFGPEAKAGVPSLVNLLREQDALTRSGAAHTLEEIRPGAKEAVPALVKSLNDREGYVREAVARALVKIAPEAETAIPPALLKKVKEQIEAEKNARPIGVAYSAGGEEGDESGSVGAVRVMVDYGTKSSEAQGHFERGSYLHQQGNLDAAIASYMKAIELDPQYAYALYGRALVQHAKGNFDAAIADLTKAVEVDSKSAEKYYYARGTSQSAKGDYDAAINDCTKVVELNPYHADALSPTNSTSIGLIATYFAEERTVPWIEPSPGTVLPPAFVLSSMNFRNSRRSPSGILFNSLSSLWRCATPSMSASTKRSLMAAGVSLRCSPCA